MGSVKLYDINIPRERITADREAVYLSKSVRNKIYSLLNLIKISVQLNGGNPLKKPEGKGLVIQRPTRCSRAGTYS